MLDGHTRSQDTCLNTLAKFMQLCKNWLLENIHIYQELGKCITSQVK